ncbi:MAG TPA: DUF4446 family protein [Patescibacteria group bacterium]|nr:DUF4446 family protein [Patescibacteria group bacterium]
MLIAVFILLGFLLIWIAVLTYFFWSLSAHYNNLVKTTNKKTLQTVVDSLLEELQVAKKDIAKLSKTCDTIIEEGRLHIQKVGLLRFNPFKETGGDQSFILALLDNNDNGVVLSGLYSRSGMRWYAKKIKNGKGMEHTLSEEEKEAIRQAIVAK